MNKFVFITHVTPVAKRNKLRQRLFELYQTALEKQTYPHWKVIQLHEGKDEQEGKYVRFHLPDVARDLKTAALKSLFGRSDFLQVIKEADYLIKLDDDDLISPVILEKLATFSGDLYYDQHHTFLDVSSGIVTQQKRNWIASTCVHQMQHALAPWSGAGASEIGNLLYTDHSKAWHLYYADKNCSIADAAHPVYARVLSPTSITSGGKGVVKTFPDVDSEKYQAYLRTFGDWQPASTNDFEKYRAVLSAAWKEFSGEEQKPLPAKSFGSILSDKLRSLKNKLRSDE